MEGRRREECRLSSIILFRASPLCGYPPGEMCGLAFWTLMWKSWTLKNSQGRKSSHMLPATICNTEESPLSCLYFLIWFPPAVNVWCFTLKMQAYERSFVGLFRSYRERVCWESWGFKWLVMKNRFAPYVDHVFKSAIFFPKSSQRTENIWFTFVINTHDLSIDEFYFSWQFWKH